MQSAGYTHLLVYRMGADYVKGKDPRYSLADWQALSEFLNRLPNPEDFGGAYQLYSLNP